MNQAWKSHWYWRKFLPAEDEPARVENEKVCKVLYSHFVMSTLPSFCLDNLSWSKKGIFKTCWLPYLFKLVTK
ncbi:hypothetical protein RJ641_006485 [Dillenia turbinata]|uniref:Uncharacterized protein n=1 Tax=Dillenia turbinata TaxID=194707 RepID=A0AAN8V6Z0_9MAGN